MALTYSPIPELGKSCPDFELLGVDERTYTRSDLAQGTPFLIVFMCNHCPYVKAIEDRLIILGKDLSALGIPMIGISSNDPADFPEDSFENMKSLSEKKKYTFPYLFDETQQVAKSFGAVCTPDFFLYDKDAKLRYRGRLDDSWKDSTKVTRRDLYEDRKSVV